MIALGVETPIVALQAFSIVGKRYVKKLVWMLLVHKEVSPRASRARRLRMNSSQSPNAPRRRIGIYELLGRSTSTSPARTFGIGIVILAIVIVLIAVLARYW
jgi:hypothetical protein